MTLDIQQTPKTDGISVAERGRGSDGQPVTLDRRLFAQLLVFGDCHDIEPIKTAVAAADASCIVYSDLHDPNSIGLVVCSESPDYFVTDLRDLLNTAPFSDLTLKPKMTMFGRTYSIGYEADLEEALLHKPLRKMTDPELGWAIWYPLRRSGAFEQVTAEEQRTMLMEHGGIGMAYGRAGHGTDIRLACHGLDRNDNDFVIALLGKELAPLSKIVERMRKTKQTSQYITSLGPFFVGKAIFQSKK